MDRIKYILESSGNNRQIAVEGWVRTKRESKGISFIEINDGSSIKNLQLVIDVSILDYHIVNEINTGTSLKVDGTVVPSQGKGQNVEIIVSSIQVIGGAPSDYVLQKKRHSFEFLREIAHLRPRTNTFGAIARIRSTMSYAIHKFFQEKDFIYVHTPIITGNDCEGAGEMFQVTTLPLDELKNKKGDVNYEEDFFGKKASLTVSGQLNGEIYATAMKNVYTFGPTFRAENSNTSRHLAEFWMVEPEMSFCDINLNMDIAEEFLKYIFVYVLEHCKEDMEFFDSRISKGLIENLLSIIESDFARISYTEAVDHLINSEKNFEFPVKWGSDLQSEHEKFLTEEIYKKPVIITDYPASIKAFYMKMNKDNKTVRAMDVLVPRLGEIIGGSEREEDFETLYKRIEDNNLNPEDYWWYLELRKYGTVPHSGFGLGFERLIQFVTGMQNIRDVIPFPRSVKNLEF
jgi:asparaginyl-tRNA synthetase